MSFWCSRCAVHVPDVATRCVHANWSVCFLLTSGHITGSTSISKSTVYTGNPHGLKIEIFNAEVQSVAYRPIRNPRWFSKWISTKFRLGFRYLSSRPHVKTTAQTVASTQRARVWKLERTGSVAQSSNNLLHIQRITNWLMLINILIHFCGYFH